MLSNVNDSLSIIKFDNLNKSRFENEDGNREWTTSIRDQQLQERILWK
jgi:hypothetical protein